ncbi:MAG: response regulator transcription factor [Acidobacteriota bacterium]|nr:response regulator transcription factor [Acidobacteriota bacterium]
MPALASNLTETATIRVVVIEDQRELREGLKILLDFTPDFRCVQSFGSMEDALAGLEADTADLILTDIGLPRMNGIEGTRVLRERFPALPIIVLTVHDEDDNIFQALCAGASGYLLKNTAPAKIVEAIKEVLNGGAPMSPDVACRVVHLFRTFVPPAEVEYHLTEQERRILKMLVDGHHYKTAAYELGISRSTVAFHLKNIYEKLRVHSKTEAVAKALREKII